VIDDVVVAPTGEKGLGVYARRAFTAGEFVFRRRHGRTVTAGDLGRLSVEEREHLCELDFDRWAVLLPPGCYLNHSCEPNAMRRGVNVVAWRAIAAGAEITIDYRLNAYDDTEVSPCLCGAPGCPGHYVNSFFALTPDRQADYLPYAPAFIRREHRRRTEAARREVAGPSGRPRPTT